MTRFLLLCPFYGFLLYAMPPLYCVPMGMILYGWCRK